MTDERTQNAKRIENAIALLKMYKSFIDDYVPMTKWDNIRLEKVNEYIDNLDFDRFVNGKYDGIFGMIQELLVTPPYSRQTEVHTAGITDIRLYTDTKRIKVECKTNEGMIDSIEDNKYIIYSVALYRSNVKYKMIPYIINVSDFIALAQQYGAVDYRPDSKKKGGSYHYHIDGTKKKFFKALEQTAVVYDRTNYKDIDIIK